MLSSDDTITKGHQKLIIKSLDAILQNQIDILPFLCIFNRENEIDTNNLFMTLLENNNLPKFSEYPAYIRKI